MISTNILQCNDINNIIQESSYSWMGKDIIRKVDIRSIFNGGYRNPVGFTSQFEVT